MLRSYSQNKALAKAQCPTCRQERERVNAFPVPVKTHILFGVSFLAFMGFSTTPFAKENALYMWAWTGLQMGLGLTLLLLRRRSQRKIYRCYRCDQTETTSKQDFPKES